MKYLIIPFLFVLSNSLMFDITKMIHAIAHRNIKSEKYFTRPLTHIAETKCCNNLAVLFALATSNMMCT